MDGLEKFGHSTTFDGDLLSKVRRFSSGATRDTDDGKFDYEAFLSPLVLEQYAAFMHKNRLQKDGSLRDGDNWQKGFPLPAYMKSLWRHFMDVWLHHRGCGYKAKEDQVTALCAIIFNASGMLHEIIKLRDLQKAKS